jgi:biopolymer transport protein ExbB
LWDALQQQIDASSQLEIVEVNASSGSGEVTQVPALRLGSFALFNDSGYLNWNGQSQRASSYAAQPEFTPTLAMQSDLVGALPVISLDATRGDLIAQLANAPTLQDRIEHGGIIGQIIIGLLIVGAFIGMVRGAVLLLTKTKISRQLKSPQTPSNNNALGRVLNVYQQDQSPNVEALELRLLEAVMDEQQQLERGLSMIKLLAALAPMLGLLGTVTGMIETFQTITQFGNADPRIMAGGISMALMTTVLGLIAAMPLLLIHNILSSQAEDIRNTIEKQGIGLVAQRAELLAEKEAT